jgi:hypothetical protein
VIGICQRIYAQLILQRLHEFDPIAERIINVNAMISFQRLIVPRVVSGAYQHSSESREVFDDKGRMSLSSRSKVRFDANMHLESAPLEPAPSALRQVRRLFSLRYAKYCLIKRTRVCFSTRRHRQLDVI